MRDKGVIYVAGHSLLNRRPMAVSASEMTYIVTIVSSGALNSSHSFVWLPSRIILTLYSVIVLQEFAPNFPPPRRPEFGHGRSWDEEEGRRFPEFPEDDAGFRRRLMRDEPEFHGRDEEQRFFRDREFGRPHDFDNGRRFPDDRRPPIDWEHEDPMHPAFRSWIVTLPLLASYLSHSLAGWLSLPCTCDLEVITLWVNCLLWVNELGQLSLLSLGVAKWLVIHVFTWIIEVESIEWQTRVTCGCMVTAQVWDAA